MDKKRIIDLKTAVLYFITSFVGFMEISCTNNINSISPISATLSQSQEKKSVPETTIPAIASPVIKPLEMLHLQGRFKINYPSPKKENQLPEVDLQGQVIDKKAVPETLLGNYQFDKNNQESGINTEKLTLASPLGETLLVVIKTTDSLVLKTSDNHTITYALPDELPLFYQDIGFQLPIIQLSEWLSLKQEMVIDGWRIIPKNEENRVFNKWLIENTALDIELVLIVE
jgi:hypothetical protein